MIMLTLLRMYVFVTLPVMIGMSIVGLIIWGVWELHQKIIREDIKLWYIIKNTFTNGTIIFMLWFCLCFLIQPTTTLFWVVFLIIYVSTFVYSTQKFK